MGARILVAEALPWMASSIPYFLASADARRLDRDLTAAGFDVRHLDGRSVTDERSLVRALGTTLSFPDYYGGNWDAFIDCAGDLAESSGHPVAIIWSEADRLAQGDLHAFMRGVHLLLSAAESLALSETRFQLEVFLLGDWSAPESS